MGLQDYEAPVVDGRAVPSSRAQALLLESHAIASRALLLGDDPLSRVEVPLLSGGPVSIDTSSAVRRSCALTILARWPAPGSRLAPYGTRVQVQRGVQVAPGIIEWIPLMTGPVVETAQTDDGVDGGTKLSFPIKDEMAAIARDRFDENTSTDTTLTVAEQCTRIIRRTLPSAEILDRSGAAGQVLVGKLDMQKDPAAGLMKIAAAAGLEVFCGRGYQQFVIRPVASLDDPPRWVISEIAGEHADIISITRKRNLDGVYNRVVATGDTAANTGTDAPAVPPVSGEARIDDPADPLFYRPGFRATRFFSSPLIITTAQATAAAAGLLAKLRGGNLELSFTALVNPAAEGGDVLQARLADGTSRHIVDKLDIPLDEDGVQSAETRGIDIPDESASAA